MREQNLPGQFYLHQDGFPYENGRSNHFEVRFLHRDKKKPRIVHDSEEEHAWPWHHLPELRLPAMLKSILHGLEICRGRWEWMED